MGESEIFSLQFRPKRFSDMIGLDKVVASIRRQAESGRFPKAWLFAGQSGCGKTTLARIVALSLQCRHDVFGEPCDKCMERSDRFAIYEINASECKGVDAVEEIAQTSAFLPSPPTRCKVYILDEAQGLSTASQRLLLKYFEEAPDTTVWIVATTEPEKLLLPLTRRCTAYSLPALTTKDTEKFLKESFARAKVDRERGPLLDALLTRNVRSPGFILQALEKYSTGMNPEDCVSVTAISVDTLRICRNMMQGKWSGIRVELEKATPEDAKGIQASVLGYLRAALVARNTTDTAKIAEAIRLLCTVHGYDESVRLAELSAMLYQVARFFGGKRLPK